jgi:4-hydroxybenzoate polyprenyltransferase
MNTALQIPDTNILDSRQIGAATQEQVLRDSSRGCDEPLCVDLDGSLVRTDTLLEGFLGALRHSPIRALATLFFLFVGKAAFKARLSEIWQLDVTHLPYNIPLLEFVRSERKRSRMIVLATGAHEQIASKIAAHLGIFDQVICTNGQTNNVSHKKAEILKATFKDTGFWYAGSANADLPVWKASAGAVVAENPKRWTKKLARTGVPVLWKCPATRNSWKEYLKAIRIHQWVKNLLVFVPVFTAHRLTDLHAFRLTVLAAAAISIIASSLYLFNDLIDLPEDRNNPLKQSRPFASGAVSLWAGICLMVACAALGLALSLFLPSRAQLALLVYAAGSFLYTSKLKRYMMMDVVGLASLYTVRILLGGYATNIVISDWLLGFSMSLFLCLALLKRTSELVIAQRTSLVGDIPGRGYTAVDLDQVTSLGSASALISVLIFALYLHSPEVTQLYSNPDRMWLICILQVYWLSRLLILGRRGLIDSDPILYIMKDRVTYVIGLACLLIVALAMRGR